MKKLFLMLQITLLICITPLFSQDLYDINTINTMVLTFAESNWDQILDSYVAAGLKDRLTGTAVINGFRFDSVGVRYKTDSSYDPTYIKCPLNIKLDHFIDDQNYGGYGTLKLSNVFNDPTFIRETLGYEIAGNYMPVPKANYIKVTVNGTYLGLYVSVQDIDNYFTNTHFFSKNNTLVKGDLPGDTEAMEVIDVWGYAGTDTTYYKQYYDLESDGGWQELIAFLDTLNNYNSEVGEVLNVDRHLWMLAFDNLIVNLDSPINFGHNYYLYRDDNNKFNPVIWDLNESFGIFNYILTDPVEMTETELQQLDPFLNETSSTYPIISKILSSETYRKTYVAHMKTIISDYFSNGLYESRANELQSLIDNEVRNDFNKFYTYQNFLDNVTGTVSSGSETFPGLTSLMAARITYLNSQTEFTAGEPVISNIYGSVSGNNAVITASVANADNVLIGYRNTEADVFTRISMYDDGSHYDGSSGDGIFGVSIPCGSTEIQYYIFAENNNTVALSPSRAEYEYHVLTLAGDVVINEFMAKNTCTAADQNAEFDDWIELFNNTDTDINLSGYYLSDDPLEPAKWQFPDVSITAGGYLIVWADEDTEQSGLHAGFKLSADGERIILMNSELKTVDEILFGVQAPDISTGRAPNGTGSFIQMEPSFNAENLYENSISETDYSVEEFYLCDNYPNPFNPVTTISYTVNKAQKINLSVYNSNGQFVEELINADLKAGVYKVNFNGSKYDSGIYFYRLKNSSSAVTKKMVLVK